MNTENHASSNVPDKIKLNRDNLEQGLKSKTIVIKKSRTEWNGKESGSHALAGLASRPSD